MPATMTALFGGTGPEWEAREVPVPEVGRGQVLVRVRAAALNNADASVLAAADPTAGGTGEEYCAGYEFAGEIAAIGADVSGVSVGERVMGTQPRSFAQYVRADHRHVLRIPDTIGPEEAASLPTGLLTEHGALQLGAFRAGQSVLITGATSAIGLLGVQIAKVLGASTVVGTTRTASKEALLVSAGADVVVVGPGDSLTEEVLEATGGQGVDVVLDHVGGRLFAACLPATRVEGHLVNIGRLDRAESTINLDHLSSRHLHLRGVSFGFGRPAELGAVLAGLVPEVIPAVADGRIRPVVDEVFPLDRAAAAVERLRTGQALGKIVLAVP
ncbi:zinc-binding dehydrogenase [Saccharopolyspora hirsuta]|uniref:Zinc-binding dehydrogenase n=1 Tax=Saccharopolyspora hirsuta TaxID=1837 RepID=A0A5M7BLL4_SACHI|nr:zinc-binding dehydrogenase [Saccharopolyspora hirsuta]KAA5830672.1 zinc-binding dehydrogenase [Saccharopolyspora hirsuta]